MNLIIDTNIIVSALLSPDGRAFQLLTEVLDGNIPYLSAKKCMKNT